MFWTLPDEETRDIEDFEERYRRLQVFVFIFFPFFWSWIWIFRLKTYLSAGFWIFSEKQLYTSLQFFYFTLGTYRNVSTGILSFTDHSINACCFCHFCFIFDFATMENRGAGRTNLGVWCLENLQVHTARRTRIWMLYWVLWSPNFWRW